MYAHLYECSPSQANCYGPHVGSFKEYKPLIPILKDEAELYEGTAHEDEPLTRDADDYGIVIGTHPSPCNLAQEWIRHKQHYGNAQWTIDNAMLQLFSAKA